MFFSVVSLAPNAGYDVALDWINNVYAEHQALWRMFPSSNDQTRDFLYRRRDDEGGTRYYIVSQRKPSPSQTSWRVRSTPYEPRLRPGDLLRFDLRANPIVTQQSNGKSVRHDVVMHEKKRLLAERGLTRWQDWTSDDRPTQADIVHAACKPWLEKRAEQLGFALEGDLSIEGYQQHRESMREPKKYDRLRFSSVDFSGVLRVVDPVKFTASLHRGVGRAKAFGCGLLLVRPA